MTDVLTAACRSVEEAGTCTSKGAFQSADSLVFDKQSHHLTYLGKYLPLTFETFKLDIPVSNILLPAR